MANGQNVQDPATLAAQIAQMRRAAPPSTVAGQAPPMPLMSQPSVATDPTVTGTGVVLVCLIAEHCIHLVPRRFPVKVLDSRLEVLQLHTVLLPPSLHRLLGLLSAQLKLLTFNVSSLCVVFRSFVCQLLPDAILFFARAKKSLMVSKLSHRADWLLFNLLLLLDILDLLSYLGA
jgi:hypothetical protein